MGSNGNHTDPSNITTLNQMKYLHHPEFSSVMTMMMMIMMMMMMMTMMMMR